MIYCILASLLFVQDAVDDSSDGSTQRLVAAVVDGYEISVKRVERHLNKTVGNRKISGQEMNVAANAALEHLIDRHIVLQQILKTGGRVGSSEVAIEWSKLNDRLAEIDKPLEQYLNELEIAKSELEYEFRWKLAWRKYLNKHLTDERLQNYFEKHRRKFDGTEMRVAHLLLESSGQKPDSTFNRAKDIKSTIAKGEKNWSSAVKEYSIAKTSAETGGDIGWVNFEGPMPRNFCLAAMELKVGDISNPIQTNFGVHLIKCLEIKHGNIGSRDARPEIESDATRFLFERLARKNYGKSKIEIRAIKFE